MREHEEDKEEENETKEAAPTPDEEEDQERCEVRTRSGRVSRKPSRYRPEDYV